MRDLGTMMLGTSKRRRRARAGVLAGAAATALATALTGLAPGAGASGIPHGDRVLPGSDPGARGQLGQHKIYVVPAYWEGDAPEPVSNTYVQGTIAAANTYWSTATAGKITVTPGWDVPRWQKISLTDEQSDSCDLAAIEAGVRGIIGSGGQRDHMVVVLDRVPQCDFTDVENIGLSARNDGVSFVNGTFDRTIALRVIAHNGGAPGAGSLNCTNGSTPVPLSSTCTVKDYNNPWDPASDHPYGQVGTPIADTLATLGVLAGADYPEVKPGGVRTLALKPLTASSGRRGFYVDLGRYRYSVDYRVPTGLDSWIDDQTWTSPKGPLADPGGGVVVHRQDLNADAKERTRLVVDFHPDGTDSDTARHPGLASGESYTSPDGLFALKVVSANSSQASVTISFPGLGPVERWYGKDRYETSAEISRQTYNSGVDVAYIASGKVYTDALSGAPVAGKNDGPVLLVSDTSVPDAIATELTRLKPDKIVIFGGPATISPEVERDLDAFTTGSVTRWAGADRYATSATISRESYPVGVGTAYIASGQVFTDALSGAPVAGKKDGPVLLVDTNRLPADIATELQRLNPAKIVILGGPATITENVEAALRPYSTNAIDRWWGDDRFSTSAAIVEKAYTSTGGTVFVASGRVFSDALSGAPAAGSLEDPVLLVDTDEVPAAVATQLNRLNPSKIVILGGPATISYETQSALATYIG